MPNQDEKKQGLIFSIQKYSVHDGPGIRTVVFLKGCPLHCLWCSNPESQNPKPQLAYNKNKCLGMEACARCVDVCTAGALKWNDDNKIRVDWNICNSCLLTCADECPSEALIVYGQTMSVEEILSRVQEDGAFYSRSGGGMTLGGGEPMQQPDFAIAILREARRRRIKTAIETCGYCKFDDLEEACQHLNHLLFDLKVMDPEKHKQVTGFSNELIHKNLLGIREKFPNLPIRVRTPVIPGVNDSEQEIGRILEFIKDFQNTEYEMLGYHRLGSPKYEYIGCTFPMGDKVLAEGTMANLVRFVRENYSQINLITGG